jgi:two-component sensor histidine kinase
VLATLEKWSMASIADIAVVVASELVTNAVKASWPSYIGEPITLWLFSDGSDVVIEVWDGSPGTPAQAPASVRDEDGRGLAIVASLSKSWGWYPDRLGKIVWALLRLA